MEIPIDGIESELILNHKIILTNIASIITFSGLSSCLVLTPSCFLILWICRTLRDDRSVNDACMHACIHTYIHTYVRTYIPCVETNLHSLTFHRCLDHTLGRATVGLDM